MMKRTLPGPGSRAFILGRYSTDLQNPMSAEDQIAACRRDCERHGWTVAGVFKDEAKSGRSTAKRTGYLDMMEGADQGLADVICVFTLDRLGRDARELHDANNRLSDRNISIHTHDRGVLSRIEFALIAEWAQAESEKMSERSKAGLHAQAKRGKIFGPLPYGYRRASATAELTASGTQSDVIEIVPEEAEVVLRCHLDFAAGLSARQISKNLNREGLKSPSGGQWHQATLVGSKRLQTGMLRHPLYGGVHVFAKAEYAMDRQTGVTKVIGLSAHPIINRRPELQIVPDNLLLQVRQILDAARPALPTRCRRPPYLLSGIVECGECGSPYQINSKAMECRGRSRGVCSNRRRVDRLVLEQLVLKAIEDGLCKSDTLDQFLPEYVLHCGEVFRSSAARRVAMTARLQEIDREIGRFKNQIAVGATGFAAEVVNDQLNLLGREKGTLALSVAAIQSDLPELTQSDVLARLRDMLATLPEALVSGHRDAHRARDIIRGFVTKIVVTSVDDPSGRVHGRGIGPVHLAIHGELQNLADAALMVRTVPSGAGTTARRYSMKSTIVLDLSIWPDGTPLGVEAWSYHRRLSHLQVFALEAINSALRPITTPELGHAMWHNGMGGNTLRSAHSSARAVALSLVRRGLVDAEFRGRVAFYSPRLPDDPALVDIQVAAKFSPTPEIGPELDTPRRPKRRRRKIIASDDRPEEGLHGVHENPGSSELGAPPAR